MRTGPQRISTGCRQNRLVDSRMRKNEPETVTREGRDMREKRDVNRSASHLAGLVSPVPPVSLGHAAEMLLDSWKERLQLHRQADVSADLKPARHGNGWPAQLALQNLYAILSRHREYNVRVRMHPLYDLAGSLPDRKNVLPALRTGQIELVDRIEIFSGI
jgi:hypothetical protein